MNENSLLERVSAAPVERHLSENTLTAYRRTWLKAIAWAAAEGLALETLLSDRVGEVYEEATRGRSASHHLQVKAALGRKPSPDIEVRRPMVGGSDHWSPHSD